MKLLMLKVHDEQLIGTIINEFSAEGIVNTIVMDCKSLSSAKQEDGGAIISSIRKLFEYEPADTKLVLAVIHGRQLQRAVDIIEKHCGDLNYDEYEDFLCVLPVDFVRGLK